MRGQRVPLVSCRTSRVWGRGARCGGVARAMLLDADGAEVVVHRRVKYIYCFCAARAAAQLT